MNAATRDAYERIRDHFTRPDAVMAVNGDSLARAACVYRGHNDPTSPVRCPGGVLIPDALYEPRMEGSAIDTVIERWEKLGEVLAGTDTAFLIHAQLTHDRIALGRDGTPARFVTELDELAFEHGLLHREDGL